MSLLEDRTEITAGTVAGTAVELPGPAPTDPCPAAAEPDGPPPRPVTTPGGPAHDGRSGLVLELAAVADPVRAGRALAALVNNTRLALTELTVGGVPAYPVPVGTVTADGPVVARFSLRHTGHVVDRLLTEELVGLVSSAHGVLSARRRP